MQNKQTNGPKRWTGPHSGLGEVTNWGYFSGAGRGLWGGWGDKLAIVPETMLRSQRL